MKVSIILLFMAAATTIISGNDGPDTIRIRDVRGGRKIMHDGFLMEWSPKTAVPWGNDTVWMCDAMATPEGLAGYLRTGSADPCSSWTLVFSAGSAKPVRVDLPPDSGLHQEMIKIDTTGSESGSAYTIEWLFRWPPDFNPMTTPFSVVIDAQCTEAERSLPTLVFEYRYKKEKPDEAKHLIGRILLIGGLGALYLMVQRKIRNQTKQRESPHQSA